MRKVLILLLLAVVIIFSAGCVASSNLPLIDFNTAYPDEIGPETPHASYFTYYLDEYKTTVFFINEDPTTGDIKVAWIYYTFTDGLHSSKDDFMRDAQILINHVPLDTVFDGYPIGVIVVGEETISGDRYRHEVEATWYDDTPSYTTKPKELEVLDISVIDTEVLYISGDSTAIYVEAPNYYGDVFVDAPTEYRKGHVTFIYQIDTDFHSSEGAFIADANRIIEATHMGSYYYGYVINDIRVRETINGEKYEQQKWDAGLALYD